MRDWTCQIQEYAQKTLRGILIKWSTRGTLQKFRYLISLKQPGHLGKMDEQLPKLHSFGPMSASLEHDFLD